MTKKDNQNLALHLTIIGFTLIIFFSSCTTTYYFKNYDYSGNEPEFRHKITERDLEQFSKTIRQRHQDPDSLYRQAIHFQRINKHKQALQVLEEAIMIDTSHAKAYNAMGISYDKIGDHPRAIEAYQRALKIEPENASVLNNLGYSYLLSGKTDAAIEAFRSAIAQDSRTAKYHNNLATAYAKKGLFDQALEEFIIASGEARGHHYMAQIYMKMDRPNKAQYHLARSKSLTPSTNMANHNKDEAKNLAVANPEAEGTSVIAATSGVEKKQTDLPKTKEPAVIVRKPISPDTETITVYRSTPKVEEKQNIPANTVESSQGSDDFIVYRSEPSFQTQSPAAASPLIPEEIPAVGIAAIAPLRLPDIRPYHSRLQGLPAHKQDQPRAKSCKVEISNGNGVNGMARKVGEYLKHGGIRVSRLTNAKHFSFSKTTIYYHRDYIDEALDIAEQLPGLQLMQGASKFAWPDVKIRVLIGRDLIAHHWQFSKRAYMVQK